MKYLILLTILSFNVFGDIKLAAIDLPLSIDNTSKGISDYNFLYGDNDLDHNIIFTSQYSLQDFDGKYIPNNYRLIYDGYYKITNDLVLTVTLDSQDNPLEELQLIYTNEQEINKDISLINRYHLGTSDVFYGFYGSADDVLTTGSGTLPQGVYSYDFIKGGFSRLFGYAFETSIYNPYDTMLFIDFKFAKGIGIVDSKQMMEYSVMGGDGSDLVNVKPSNSSVISLKINYYDKITIFVLNSKHEIKFSKQSEWTSPSDTGSFLLHFGGSKYVLDIDRIGLQFLIENYEFTIERYKLSVINDNIDVPGSKGGYFTIHGYHGNIVSILGLSRAKSDNTTKYTKDVFIGLTKSYKKHTISAEYHIGTGASWIIEGDKPKHWKALIGTYRYQF